MSDPKSPDDPSRPPIVDAASLFDSRVIYTFKPAEESEPASPGAKPVSADDLSEYGLDIAPTAPTEKPRATPRPSPRVAKPSKPKPVASDRNFDPGDDEPDVAASGVPSSSTIRAERQSAHIDPESDSSDRAPSRSKRRSSDRAIGFDEVEADEETAFVEEDHDEVDPVWTRAAEWGPDLVRVGLVAPATLVLAWFSLNSLDLLFLILLVGGAACVLLSYPIAVTIERPVRITPEQAVSDFFFAASHHFPHYRRMWLLLTPTARASGRFSTYDSFKTHWAERVAHWKKGRGGLSTPLTFRVSDFRGDKSVGQSTSQVEYTVRVTLRDQEAGKPIASYSMAHRLVKGPDRMWYLDQATLASSGR